MKVFISWSGPLAQLIAEKLRTWLKRVIQVLEPFVSSQDIQKGDVWLNELLRQLEQSSIGIICVTREGLHSDWLLFETGALAKHIGRAKVCTLLIDVTPLELGTPLSGFQATTIRKDDVLGLMRSINSSLERRVLSDQELELEFAEKWEDLESFVRDTLKTWKRRPSELQQLTEELLVPVINREARSGDLDTVFHWLEIAQKRNATDLEGHLGFIEACLARITGKRRAGQNLGRLSRATSEFCCNARLELLFVQFADRQRLDDVRFDPRLLGTFPESARRTTCALLGLWHLREGREDDARRCLDQAAPENMARGPDDYYRAVPLGVLCLALGKGVLGEKQFDLAKKDPVMPHEGYPFISLLSDFDRTFVNVCIGHADTNRSLPEKRIGEFRGHAWVLVQYADLMRNSPLALRTLVDLSSGWKVPLQQKAVSSRLLQLQKRLIAHAGVPLVTKELSRAGGESG